MHRYMIIILCIVTDKKAHILFKFWDLLNNIWRKEINSARVMRAFYILVKLENFKIIYLFLHY